MNGIIFSVPINRILGLNISYYPNSNSFSLGVGLHNCPINYNLFSNTVDVSMTVKNKSNCRFGVVSSQRIY